DGIRDLTVTGVQTCALPISQWTTSVCTGSLLLGAAGLLDGLEATTHWQELETLRRFGATPTSRRVVRQGKLVTAAGVSSGIDMRSEERRVGKECRSARAPEQ